MKELNLSLTIEETNLILDTLANKPFKEVFGLISKIQNQAAKQLQNDDPKVEIPQ
jgi:hypothetical protein